MNSLIERINLIKKLGQKLIEASQTILQLAENDNIQLVVEGIDNRDRLIEIINQLQEGLDDQIKKASAGEINDEIRSAFQDWQISMGAYYQEADRLNQIILERLEEMRFNTSREIGKIFKGKEKIKGYNLNNVK